MFSIPNINYIVSTTFFNFTNVSKREHMKYYSTVMAIWRVQSYFKDVNWNSKELSRSGRAVDSGLRGPEIESHLSFRLLRVIRFVRFICFIRLVKMPWTQVPIYLRVYLCMCVRALRGYTGDAPFTMQRHMQSPAGRSHLDQIRCYHRCVGNGKRY